MSSSKIQKSNQQQVEVREPHADGHGILNVAEMLLHGVADHEILDVWLYRINCQELVKNFIESGYDVPTLSRTTPQDLTAIGITDPSKRQKILSEIRKLNLQDGIPNFKPASLSHLLSLIKLDKYYYRSLCDQNIDTLEKLCQLTWEDFEELGITKLGHQKRLQLAIERLKSLDNESKNTAKPVSEPIYDTNPKQILLVASTENHSNNGPIINKQPSTGELSSTGSGSLHSVYSSTSYQQANYAALQQQRSSDSKSLSSVTYNVPSHNISQPPQQRIPQNQPSAPSQQQQQSIYGYIKAPTMPPIITYPLPRLPNQNMSQHQMLQSTASQNSVNDATSKVGSNLNMAGRNDQYQPIPSMQNRQSLCQLPFSALANLPKHQQQLLQQSSIYATLSRCPGKPRQPPPVPARKDSLKTASLTEYLDKCKASDSQRAGSSNSQILMNKRRINSQVTLTKNKSFSGNAHMEASRMRFLHNNMQNKSELQPSQEINPIESRTSSLRNDLIYGLPTQSNFSDQPQVPNNFDCVSLSGLGQVYQQLNQNPNQISASATSMIRFHPSIRNSCPIESNDMRCSTISEGGGFLSETISSNSLALTSTSTSTSTAKHDNDHHSTTSSSLRQSHSSDNNSSGSSQTLYNSASSGSNDQNLDGCIFPSAFESRQDHNNPQQIPNNNKQASTGSPVIDRNDCNATTGRDDNFPPPPSPLSLSELDENDLASFNLDKNFTDMNRGMMAFRIGI